MSEPTLATTVDEEQFRRRGLPPRPRRVPCEFCGTPLVDPVEEPFNLAFIAHLKASDACMERFSYGMAALRAELAVRHGQRVSGL
ncbi:MAG TPA: hypothetical protein VHH36_08045 [Candidatus Thermoplasmatota archaeon]|nr:hypothetical protein [Candidatus Thermoplasmatota archaeon]